MDCRDDLTDTAIAGDGAFVRQRHVVEDSARASDSVFLRLVSSVTDGASLDDGSSDRLILLAHETVTISETLTQALQSANVAHDGASLHDSVFIRLRTLVEDGASLGDSTSGKLLILAADVAELGDGSSSQRTTQATIAEQARARDSIRVIWRDLVEETAQASDSIRSFARIKTVATDTAVAGDELSASGADARILLVDAARLLDSALIRNLVARTVVDDGAALEDAAIQWGAFGQAWTANTDNWAMSRYAPFTFTTLAVVDGILMGCAEDGVYALDGRGEKIAAHLATGKLDMTHGVLSHPVEAHFEYALDGTASVDVTTTQAGMAKTYRYPLKGRPVADELTNARAPFGRGLRGRHFAYTLNLTGTHAHINDWSVLIAPSKRSI